MQSTFDTTFFQYCAVGILLLLLLVVLAGLVGWLWRPTPHPNNPLFRTPPAPAPLTPADWQYLAYLHRVNPPKAKWLVRQWESRGYFEPQRKAAS
jgi:hypothetical protein